MPPAPWARVPGERLPSYPAAARGLAPGAGIWGLGPRPSGPGWGLRAGRPRGPLPSPPAGACLSLPSVFGLSSPGWRVEGIRSAWRWGQREGGGDSPHFPLRNGGEWEPRVRGPGLSARGWRAMGVGRGGGHLSIPSTKIASCGYGEWVKMKWGGVP